MKEFEMYLLNVDTSMFLTTWYTIRISYKASLLIGCLAEHWDGDTCIESTENLTLGIL